MHQQFHPAVLNHDRVQCPKCNWSGKGSDLQQEELFLTDAIELYCPRCESYLGFVSTSAPTHHSR